LGTIPPGQANCGISPHCTLHALTQKHPPLEAQLQATLNVIPIQAWYAAPSGTLIFVNEATAAYLRLPRFHHLRFGAEVGGTWESHLVFVHPEDRAHARRKWAACLRKHTTGELQLRVLGTSGMYRWFLTRTEPLRARDGRLLYWVGINVDIDDEKRAGVALNEAMERIARATQLATVAELSASIAHEIVQPLSAMVANARASLNWLSGENPDIFQAKAVIERVLEDGMSVGNVVHKMRRLFKREPPNKKPIQINHLIEQVLELLDTDLRNEEITIFLEVLPDLAVIEADAVQIQQVLLNLMHNARDALLPQSSASKRVTIRTLCSDHTVTVEVEDNGPGIVNLELYLRLSLPARTRAWDLGSRSAASLPRRMEAR
jgi:signal transduction histidine kinase